MQVTEFQQRSIAGFERDLKAWAIVTEAEPVSGWNGKRRGRGLVIECGTDVANADDTDQAVVLDHWQVTDMVPVHQMANMFERIGRTAGDQLLHRDELRNLQIDAGRAVFGDGANHVALREHPDRGIAFGPNHVLDYKRADIAGAHQLGGNTDGLIHSNRRNTGSLLAQDVSDLHRNLPQMSSLYVSAPY